MQIKTLVLGKGDVAANVGQPGNAVEFGKDGLDLPAVGIALRVLGLQDGDALDGVGREGDEPSKGDRVTGHGIDGQNLEGNGGLSALAGLECRLVGERRVSQWCADQRVDAVRKVRKVVRQQFLGVGSGIVGEEPAEAIDEVLRRCRRQALAGVEAPVAPKAAPGSSSSRRDEGGNSNE